MKELFEEIWDAEEVPFNTLLGKTLISITQHEDKYIVFMTADERYIMYHDQECCETVTIEDIDSPLDLLVGYPILVADERTSKEEPKDKEYDDSEYDDSEYNGGFTWTFYRIGTVKATSVIRWYGTSNGYYSEGVSLYKMATINSES